MSVERHNLLHPTQKPRKSYVETALEGHRRPGHRGDRLHAQLRRPDPRSTCGRRYVTLGTDGFGRSDYRVKLRKFFEVNRFYVTVAALKALADDGVIKADVVEQAIKKYGLDTERRDPWTM